MPEQLPQELLDIADRADRFAIDVLLPLKRAVLAGEVDARQARKSVIEHAKEVGFFQLTQPRSVGGTAASTLTLVTVIDALAQHNPEWLSDVLGPGPGILAAVDEPLRSRYLLPLLAGHKRAGFGFTEPPDAAHYTRATRSGDSLLVSGQKSYVTRGAEVDFINVLADIDDGGRAFIVVNTDLPGVKKSRLFSTIDGTEHAAFEFVDVRVPASHLVGIPGEGMSNAMRQIGDTRIKMAAQAVGLGRWVLAYLTTHIQRAERNGDVKHTQRLRYGELRIKLYVARSALYRAARLADSGANVVNEGIAAKAFATETLSEIVDTAIQLVGGSALESAHPLAQLYQSTRVLRVAEGLTDVLRLSIARGALDLGRGTL